MDLMTKKYDPRSNQTGEMTEVMSDMTLVVMMTTMLMKRRIRAGQN